MVGVRCGWLSRCAQGLCGVGVVGLCGSMNGGRLGRARNGGDMAKSSWLGGVVVVWVIGGCFKPAIEREVVDDGEVEDVGGEVEVEDTSVVEIDTGVGVDGGDTVEVDAAETVGCEGASGSPCDDGDPCTREDRCGTGGCEGIPYVCDDGLSCTEDQCDGSGGCSYPVAGGACLIGGACFAAGEVKADDPCRVCAGGQAWSPNDGGVCEDGDEVCTVGDRCEGLVCVGGPRPSDAATDWALRPVTPRPPSTAIVWGVGRAAFRDTLIVVAGQGATEYTDNTGDVSLSGDSVAVLRRTEDGGIISPLVYDGFEKAEVAAFAQPDLVTNRYALAVELEGEGQVLEFGTSSPLDASEPTTQLVVGESEGRAVWTAEWPHTVYAVGLDNNVDMLVAGGYSGDLNFSELGGQVSTLSSGRYVVEVDSAGAVTWAVTFKGQQGVTGRPKVCPLGGHGAVVSTTFEQVLSIESTGREPLQATGDAQATPTFMWIEHSGAEVEVSTPFRWSTLPPIGAGTGPALVTCDANSAMLSIRGRLDSTQQNGGRYDVRGGEPGATLVRLRRDGTIEWAVTFEEALLGQNEATVLRQGTEYVAVWSKGNTVAGAIIDTAGARIDLSMDSLAGVAYLTAQGEVRLNHILANETGLPVIVAAAGLTNGTLLLGGGLLYADARISGADGDLTIEATADVTPLLVGIGTNRGLSCLGQSSGD